VALCRWRCVAGELPARRRLSDCALIRAGMQPLGEAQRSCWRMTDFGDL
jgi:hypothetical protein